MRLRPRANDGPPVPLRLKVPGSVHRALTSYVDYYAHQHGESIDVPDLVIEIVRTFVSLDREFRGWQRNGRAPTPRQETGTNTRTGRDEGPAAH